MNHPRALPALLVAAAVLLTVAGLAMAQTPGPEDTPVPATPLPEAGTGTPGAPLTGTLVAGPTPTPTIGPPVAPPETYPFLELMPNNELVYGVAVRNFDTAAYVSQAGGYLASYSELVYGLPMTGAQIVQMVAEDYSLGPRALLALVQTYSRWVTDPNPVEKTFPVGEAVPGLYNGLAAAADNLNRLYYGHRYDSQRAFPVAGGAQVLLDGTNSATFSLVGHVSRNVALADWGGLELPSRYAMAYGNLFGDPFAFSGGPDEAPPENLPKMELPLPFLPGEIWYYAVGPHSGQGVGGPPAAIDFAPPPAEVSGCGPSPAWVTAVATGRVMASRPSALILEVVAPGQPLDGFAGSGWAHVYGHLATADRVTVGTLVRPGDRLGHPSCEAGLTDQARFSFSRRYDGEWIPADDARAPLVLGGWAALPGPQAGTGFLAHAGLPLRTAQLAKDPSRNGVTAVTAPPTRTP